MARIGILTCSNATQDLGCSSASCLAEFRVDAIHFTYCMKVLCPFKGKYKAALEEAFPNIKIVIGTHQENITPEEYRERVKNLFNQPRKTMVDLILNRDK